VPEHHRCVRSINLATPDDAAAKLAELARRDYRAPRQQATALLVEAIERAARAKSVERNPETPQERAGVAS
jgi:hypothetical protein